MRKIFMVVCQFGVYNQTHGIFTYRERAIAEAKKVLAEELDDSGLIEKPDKVFVETHTVDSVEIAAVREQIS